MEGKHLFEWCILKLKENVVALSDLSSNVIILYSYKAGFIVYRRNVLIAPHVTVQRAKFYLSSKLWGIQRGRRRRTPPNRQDYFVFTY